MANSMLSSSMQNLNHPTNTSAMASGIVPSNANFPQPVNMQSTTPSVANGKGDMRGWLYKWTNVNLFQNFDKRKNID